MMLQKDKLPNLPEPSASVLKDNLNTILQKKKEFIQCAKNPKHKLQMVNLKIVVNV
jgi:hypothetical protein